MKIFHRFIAVFIFLYSCISVFPLGAQQQVIRLSHPALRNGPNEVTRRRIEIYEDAFNQLGYDLEIVYFPAVRCPIEADSGEVDGVFLGDDRILGDFDNLLKVNVPITTHYYAIFSTDPDKSYDGWSSLENSDMLVYYYKGLEDCEDFLSEYLDADQIGAINVSEYGLRMLASGRCDAFIDIQDRVENVISRNEDLKGNIFFNGVMQEVNQYLLLNSSHADLIPQLEIILESSVIHQR